MYFDSLHFPCTMNSQETDSESSMELKSDSRFRPEEYKQHLKNLKPDSVILKTLSAATKESFKTQTLNDLRLSATCRGLVVGRLVFTDDGDRIDCTKMGRGGKPVPSIIRSVGDMSSDGALFILLVDNDAVFTMLAQERFYNRFPCIILSVTASDFPTRLFFMKMKMELKLPVLAFFDCFPHGLKILSDYGCGDIKWLGLRPSDLDKYNIPVNCRLRMTEQDVRTAKDLLEDDFVKKNPRWVEELYLMAKTKQKAEIEAFGALGLQYLTLVYLPLKLQQQDWI